MYIAQAIGSICTEHGRQRKLHRSRVKRIIRQQSAIIVCLPNGALAPTATIGFVLFNDSKPSGRPSFCLQATSFSIT